MKRTFFVKRMALLLTFLLMAAVIPVIGSAEESVSKNISLTYAYTNDPSINLDLNTNGANPKKTIDNNWRSYYQPGANIDNLYIVYSVPENSKINHMKIRSNVTELSDGSFSLYYTDAAYSEGQEDASVAWKLVTTDAASIQLPEDFAFDTISASQIKLVLNKEKSRPVFYEVCFSYVPFQTTYYVDAVNRTLTDIPFEESDVATVKSRITPADGYQYNIYSTFIGAGDEGNVESVGDIAASDKLVVTDSDGAYVEEYTFIPGSASIIVRSDDFVDKSLTGNKAFFGINVPSSSIYMVPKSYTVGKLKSILKMDYPGTLQFMRSGQQLADDEVLIAKDSIKPIPQNGDVSMGYAYNVASVAETYSTSSELSFDKSILFWDDAKTTLWLTDDMKASDLLSKVTKAAGSALALLDAEGNAVAADAALATGMKLVCTAESGSETELTTPNSSTYPIMVDYALKKMVTDSSNFYGSSSRDRAIDGDKVTYLGLTSNSGYAVIDLLAKKTLDTISLRLQNPDAAAQLLADRFTISVSDDGETFREVRCYGVKGTALPNETDIMASIKETEARYIKVDITNNTEKTETMTKKAAIRLINVSAFKRGITVGAEISLKQNGTELTAINPGAVTAEAKVMNGSSLAASAKLILATYKGDMLSDVIVTPIVLTDDSEKVYTGNIELKSGDTKVQAFLWSDTTEGMQPLCRNASVGD